MGDDVAGLIDRREASAALVSYSGRLAALLRTRPDRDVLAIGSWTLGDVANHLVWGAENYTRWLRGEDAPDLDAIVNMPRWNVETVRRLPPADLPELAERLEVATGEFVAIATAMPALSRVRWYAGNRIPVEVAVAMRLIEAAVHGMDVARPAKHKWDIAPDDARIMSYGLGYIGPYFVDDEMLDFDGTIRLRIRRGADLYYVVRERRLDVRTSGPRPSWNLSVDPVSWVLVATGRKSQWTAALMGKIVGWGTRPLLPFKLRAATLQG